MLSKFVCKTKHYCLVAFSVLLWHENKGKQMVIRVGCKLITQSSLPRTILIYIRFSITFVLDNVSQFGIISQMIAQVVNGKQVLKQPFQVPQALDWIRMQLHFTVSSQFNKTQQLKETYICRLRLTWGTQINGEIPLIHL